MKKYIIAIPAIAFLMAACTPMDAYKEFAGKRNIIYPGKIEEAYILPGDGRVFVAGICRSDPKVVNCRIYWNLRRDSVDVQVDMSNGPFLLEKEIRLKEQLYSFDIITIDADGNRSIPVNISGRAYGDKYRSMISNRLVKSFSASGVIDWWEIDTTNGAYETEVVYTNTSNQEVTVTVPADEMKTTLTNYKTGTDVKYTTLYLPSEDCVDIFRTETDTIEI